MSVRLQRRHPAVCVDVRRSNGTEKFSSIKTEPLHRWTSTDNPMCVILCKILRLKPSRFSRKPSQHFQMKKQEPAAKRMSTSLATNYYGIIHKCFNGSSQLSHNHKLSNIFNCHAQSEQVNSSKTM